jgi:membrane-associated phospholipid phosphatase
VAENLMTAVATGRDRSTARSRGDDLKSALVRLIPAAVVLWAVMCGLGYLLTHPLKDTAFERWDGAIDRFFARHRQDPWTTVTHLLTFAAETYTVIGIGLVFFIGMRVHLGRWRESCFLLAAVVGEVLIFVGTTLIIDRHRPAVPHLDSAPPTSSFPSGHTAAACTLYGALALIALCASNRTWLRTLAVVVGVVVPVSVALARLYRGMHFPTDVMGGVLLAVIWLAITFAVIERRRR